MPTSMQLALPAPNSEEEFEDLVMFCLRGHHQNPHLERVGRKGQGQHGIDGCELINPSGLVWQATIQVAGLLKKLREDLALFDAGPFAQHGPFLYVVAVPRDINLQHEVAAISDSRIAQGLCPVAIVFWQDLQHHLPENIRRRAYPTFGSADSRIDEVRSATARIEDQQLKMLELLAAEKGVPLPALQHILERLGETDVPIELVPERLRSAVDDLLRLREQLRGFAFAEVDDIRTRAREFLDVGDLDAARSALREAREKVSTARRERARQEATLLIDEAGIDLVDQRFLEAAAHFAEARALSRSDIQPEHLLMAWEAHCHHRYGANTGDDEALRRAIELFDQAVLKVPHGQEWAALQQRRGRAILDRGLRSPGRETLAESVDVFAQALAVVDAVSDFNLWATITLDYCNALTFLGEREPAPNLLPKAVAECEQALRTITVHRLPVLWVGFQKILGNALRRLGERERDPSSLTRPTKRSQTLALHELTG